MLTHLSLFSGIGGLDLAAESAGFVTIGQCEYADYQTKVLERHWPDVPRWRDIHGLSADDFIRRTGHKTVTVISGGFPCQPHSVAGLRKASGDERDLWPEYRRIIGEIKPRWVVAENVRGLLSSEDGRFFRGILRDFADMGFDVGWCCFRAADVGTIHARERVGIIAHCRSKRNMAWEDEITQHKPGSKHSMHGTDGHVETSSNSSMFGLQRRVQQKVSGEQRRSLYTNSGSVEDWQRRSVLFEPKLCRSLNGVPDGVDRVKALGNAVVPQQFYPIFKEIYDIEQENTNDNLSRNNPKESQEIP